MPLTVGMTTVAKIVGGIIVLVVLFAVGTSLSTHTPSSPMTGLGAPAVAGTSTTAASTGAGY